MCRKENRTHLCWRTATQNTRFRSSTQLARYFEMCHLFWIFLDDIGCTLTHGHLQHQCILVRLCDSSVRILLRWGTFLYEINDVHLGLVENVNDF